jgi:predicted DNA-binding transcriptional regulator AlpA
MHRRDHNRTGAPMNEISEIVRVAAVNEDADRLIKLVDVCRITTLSRSTIRRLQLAKRFPRHRILSRGRKAFLLSEIEQWMNQRRDWP